MPYGKGTYGSQVGRPAKKSKNSEMGHSRKGKTKGTNYKPGKKLPAMKMTKKNKNKDMMA